MSINSSMAGILKGNANVSGLTCPVCYNSYKTNDENNIPRSLNCGHTYCTGCLEKLMSERNDAVMIRCPTCKRETVLLTLDCTHSLPKNFGLLEIISIYENDEVETLDNDSISDNKPVCNEHDEPMKVYCHTDKCLICIYCQVYGEHAGHNCELICELVKAKKDSISDVYRHCMQSLNNLLQSKTRNDESFTVIIREDHALEEKIGVHFKKLHSELEKREQCLKKRMHAKIREQALPLLKHERMLCDLISNGNELRKLCCKLLKSLDYSVLVNIEKTNIGNLMDELLDLSSRCDDSAPKLSCQLSWDFEGELMDVIKLHGQIVEKCDPVSLNECLVREDDQAVSGQSHDDVVETLNRMFDTTSLEQQMTVPTANQIDLEDDEVVDEVTQEEPVEEVEDDEIEEGAVGLVNLAHDNSNLIHELRSEMRREIQRLKNIAIPVSVEYQELSDSSSENDVREDELRADVSKEQNLSNMFSRLHSLQAQHDIQQQQDEEQYEQLQDRHYHLLQEHHKQHQRALRSTSRQCEPRVNHGDVTNACRGLCNVPNKCHQTQAASNKHGHHFGPGRHCQHTNTNLLEFHKSKIGHVGKCRMCHIVKDNGSHDICNKCQSNKPVASSSDIICPMCTLVNETDKSKCELCGFNLRE